MSNERSGKLNIVVAVYGLEAVTENIQALVKKGAIETLELPVNNNIIGVDGWPGQIKSLTVVYNYDGGPLHVAGAKESETLLINTDVFNESNGIELEQTNDHKVSVLAATYGPQNVTEKILTMVDENNELSFPVDNDTLGDTWFGIAKVLVLVLGYDDVVVDVKVYTERDYCSINLDESVEVEE